MKRLRISIRTLTLLSLPTLAPALLAQAQSYSGSGYLEQLPQTGVVASTGLLDLQGQGELALAVLYEDGSLYINPRANEYADAARLDANAGYTAFDGLAISRSSGERLWSSYGGSLTELRWTSTAALPSLHADPSVTFSDLSHLKIQECGSGSVLTAIDQEGQRVRVWDLVDENWQLRHTLLANAVQGEIHDVVVVRWTAGPAQHLALLSDNGLEIYSPALVLHDVYLAPPDDAFLDVLPGPQTQWGRDLLIWHARYSASSPALLAIANDTHVEAYGVDALDLDQVAFGEFLPSSSPWPELVLSRGDQRSAYVLEQRVTQNELESIFNFAPGLSYEVDLDPTQSLASQPVSPARCAFGDLDGDADVDIVYVDDQGRALVTLSQANDQELQRIALDDTAPSSVPLEQGLRFLYDPLIVSAPQADQVQLEVWVQFDPTTSAPAQLVWSEERSVAQPVDIDLAVLGADELSIFQVVMRGLDTSTGQTRPARILYWCEDELQLQLLRNDEPQIYAWEIEDPSQQGGGGGTARRPKIQPGSITP